MASELVDTKDRVSTGLLGKKGELLVTNRLLKDYEVFFPYFDRGVDLIIKKKDEKKFFTVQCKTRDFRDHKKWNLTVKNLIIRKEDFEKFKTGLDFLIFVLYFGEEKSRFVIFPIDWLEKVLENKKQTAPVKKNYILAIKHQDGKILYEPRNTNISKEYLDISRFVDEQGWQQLK